MSGTALSRSRGNKQGGRGRGTTAETEPSAIDLSLADTGMLGAAHSVIGVNYEDSCQEPVVGFTMPRKY